VGVGSRHPEGARLHYTKGRAFGNVLPSTRRAPRCSLDGDPPLALALFAVVRLNWQVLVGLAYDGRVIRVDSQLNEARRRRPVLLISWKAGTQFHREPLQPTLTSPYQ
jgi:hypothetical protein